MAEAALPYLTRHFGNPSSSNRYADEPRAAVAAARARVPNLIGAVPDNIVFTGSGTDGPTARSSATTPSRRSAP